MRQWCWECGETRIPHTGSVRSRSPIPAASSPDTVEVPSEPNYRLAGACDANSWRVLCSQDLGDGADGRAIPRLTRSPASSRSLCFSGQAGDASYGSAEAGGWSVVRLVLSSLPTLFATNRVGNSAAWSNDLPPNRIALGR